MLQHCIYNLLDHILPSSGKSKHDTLRLEHLCAIKIMDSGSDMAVGIIRNIPPRMFEPVLQAVIYNCYLKCINHFNTSTPFNQIPTRNVPITFPETMGIPILNWPEGDFNLTLYGPNIELAMKI